MIENTASALYVLSMDFLSDGVAVLLHDETAARLMAAPQFFPVNGLCLGRRIRQAGEQQLGIVVSDVPADSFFHGIAGIYTHKTSQLPGTCGNGMSGASSAACSGDAGGARAENRPMRLTPSMLLFDICSALAIGEHEVKHILATAGGVTQTGRSGNAFLCPAYAEMARCHSLGQGISLSRFVFRDDTVGWKRLALSSSEGIFFLSGHGWPYVLALLSQSAVRARTRREGVIVAWVDETFFCAALVYQDSIYGFWEQPAPWTAGLEVIPEGLEGLRTGWYPQEKAALHGGWATVCFDLPQEAEGFKPMYMIGGMANRLSGQGQICTPEGLEHHMGCVGLSSVLYALGSQET